MASLHWWNINTKKYFNNGVDTKEGQDDWYPCTNRPHIYCEWDVEQEAWINDEDFEESWLDREE